MTKQQSATTAGEITCFSLILASYDSFGANENVVKKKVFMRKKLCTCVIDPRTSLRRPLQNNNGK